MNKETETENPQNNEPRFTAKDMLRAFRHGRNFNPSPSDKDLSFTTSDEKLPFWEWLNRYYGS